MNEPKPQITQDQYIGIRRDFHQMASVIRAQLREKRRRMTRKDIADMIGEVGGDNFIKSKSPFEDALSYLMDIGLITYDEKRKRFESNETKAIGDYIGQSPFRTNIYANVSQSQGMAIMNNRLKKS